MKYRYGFILIWLLNIHSLSAAPVLDPEPRQINAVRFDPSYYYNSDLEIDIMADQLVSKWRNNGFNTIFYKVYDPIYGAKYRTDYELNIEADYGKQDLLKHVLKAAQKYHVSVIAWVPAFLHKNAWDTHPEWRIKNQDNSDYQPTPESYFLCPADTKVRAWWLGFVQDLLDNYPGLDGVDIAEPIVKWNDHRCYCEICSASKDSLHTSKCMTNTLNQTIELINSYNKVSCITSVVTPGYSGGLLSIQRQILESGFDLNGILDSASPPDWFNPELMWQQWADLHGNVRVFNPSWLDRATREIIRQVDGRATLLGHLEQTSFGDIKVTADSLARAIRIVKDAGIEHIDIYDTHLLEEQQAWNVILPQLVYVKTKNILVVTDPLGENDAKQVTSLLSHFKTRTTFYQIDESSTSIPVSDSLDYIFYVGVDSRFAIPQPILGQLSAFNGTVCWINYGMDFFLAHIGNDRLGFQVTAIKHDSLLQQVFFKGYDLPRLDPSYVETAITDSNKCRVLVEMTGSNGNLPYIIKSSNVWYVADLPTAFVTEGGRQIVLADMLHDILHEDHREKKTALVRIEDIHPLSDIEALSQVIKYLKSQKALFTIGVVPFYLDPESNVTATLEDSPEFVELLKDAQKSGGTIIMHGSTHQFRGETTADYEFWDGMTEELLFSDSKEYVRQKLISGLTAFRENGIYPVVWETPHYAASQMDYGVINRFFSTSYERRQTVDMHGSDQLLPYLIYNHTAGGKVIPENLGYIPLQDPDPTTMLRAAEHNLAVRDGVASFFFHTFVDHKALKTIIPQLKKMGYEFSSPRYTAVKVTTPQYQAVTVQGTINMTLNDQYYHEFFIDDNGKTKHEFFSDSLRNETINKSVMVPEGWIFIAEKLNEKPKSALKKLAQSVLPSVPKLTRTIFRSDAKSLMDVNAIPIRAAALVDSSAESVTAVSQYNMIKGLSVAGIDVEIYNVRNLVEVPENINLLLVTQAAGRQLTDQQTLFITYALQHGLNVVMEEHSSLSQNIGVIAMQDSMTIEQVVDEYFPGVEMHWKTPDTLRAFDVDIDYVSYYSDQQTGSPLVIGGEYGDGKYLFFGTLFDPYTEYGYGRYPYFIDLLQRQFNLVPTVRRNNLEIYFEPGDREDISIEDLIKIWRNNGVRRIYVSTWHFYEQYTYDYERLIDLAHQNAMLVYAWLEVPHISEKFWDLHPEWREITATGREAKVDWRRNMAVDIPECRQAMFAELSTVLLDYNWDGINFAELYYESIDGYKIPEKMTPMNNYVRDIYQQQYGYDPINIFKPSSSRYWKRNKRAANDFYDFRQDRIYFLHGEFLKFMYDLKKQNNREWEILVTMLESEFSPKVGRATAIDTRRILQWQDQYPFTIQIEDPQPLWALGPDRYTKILNTYSDIVNTEKLILDINVVPWRDASITLSPTSQPTGLELYQLAKAASGVNTRVAIYSEASLYQVDFPVITYVLASRARETIRDDLWTIETPYTVNTLLDVDAHSDIMLNGVLWPAYYKGRAIIPPGRHQIQPVSKYNSFVKKFKSDVRLVDLSGELIDAQTISRGVKFKYHSQAPCLAVVSQKPIQVYLDDKLLDVSVQDGEVGHSLRLPAGDHHVTVFTQTSGTQTLKYASVVISGMIVVLGILAGLVLSLIYLQNTKLRKRASV